MIGGTVSAIVGGKFANGAVTAAFVHMFNAELSEINRDPESVSMAGIILRPFSVGLSTDVVLPGALGKV